MSQENVENAAAGRLLCAIGNASAHIWALKGSDVFLYEQGIAAIRVTAKETYKAFGKKHATTLGPRPGLADRGSAPIQALVEGDPANRFIARSEIADARLGHGMIVSRLALTLSDGTTLRWFWLGQPSRKTVRWALDQMRPG